MKADQASVVHKLKIARGQLDGILKMVEDNRYCIDISNQLAATEKLLKNVNRQILEAHIRGCVRDALRLDDGETNAKVEEALGLLERMMDRC